MTNQFQHKLVSNIRQFILAGKPARIGHLGVFCLVHKEPEEKMREDGSLILTPPANVIEFMPDPHLRIVDENPLIKNLCDDLYYDKELLKEALRSFANDISNGAEECSVMVQGLGAFKKADGVLTFKPAADFAKAANKVYDGLKEIELMHSGNTPESHQSDSERSELISVIRDGKLNEPANEDFKQYFIHRDGEESKAATDEAEEIDVFSEKNTIFDDDTSSDEIFEDDDITLNYEFGSALGFDDGLESFGRKKPARQPESDDDEKIDIFGERSFAFNEPYKKDEELFKSEPDTQKPKTEEAPHSEALSEADKEIESDEGINIFETFHEADFEQDNKNISFDDDDLTPLDEFKKSQAGEDDFFFADFKKEDKSRHEAFEEDLNTFSLKISLSEEENLNVQNEVEKEEKLKKEKEEAERKALEEQKEAKRRKELEEQKRLEAERKAKEKEEAENFDREFKSDAPGAFRLRRKSGNLNADTSHFEDDIITPVRPSSDGGFNDKGLGVAISIAAIILFGIMIYLVYTLFPAEEPDFRPTASVTTAQSQRLIQDPFAEGSENEFQAGLRGAQQQQQQAQNLIPPTESGALTYDDILLELTRQNRGGLFGLYGEYNENISPFYGIVLFATNFRREADDFARTLKEENDWRATVIPHQRSDGSRGWRVMAGQFSTLSDANIEARLLPSRYREEFLIQRYERPEE